MKRFLKPITILATIAICGCGWLTDQRKTTCTVNQYAETIAGNGTSRDLQVNFCSTTVSTGNNPQTVSSQSEAQWYYAFVGSRQQETIIPFADSQGDGCRKILGSGEKVADAVPMLSAGDLATTKTCFNGSQYSFVDVNQSCPAGYSVFDQTAVTCK
jgi:hypothetical protein